MNKRTLRNVVYVMKTLWSMNRWYFVVTFITLLIDSIQPAVSAYLFKLMIDELAAGLSTTQFATDKIVLYLSVWAFLDLLSHIASNLRMWMNSVSGLELMDYLQYQLILKFRTLDMASFENDGFHDKLEKVRNYSLGRFHQYYADVWLLLGSTLSLVTSILILVSHPVLIVLAVLSAVPGVINDKYKAQLNLQSVEKFRSLRRTRFYFYRILVDPKQVSELRIFRAFDIFIRKLHKILATLAMDQFGLERKFFFTNTVTSFVNMGGMLGAYIYMVISVFNFQSTIGDFSFYTGRYNSLSSQTSRIFRAFRRMGDNSEYVEDYFDILNTKPAFDIDKGIDFTDDKVRIEFEDVWFKYPGSKRYILRGVSFTVAEGEKIALVGENGAGKTTIVKLLSRFYDPTKGRILVNGVDLREYNLQSWYKKLGVLFQDYNRYDLPVSENIGVGSVEDIDNLSKIKEAAKKSGAAEVIAKLDGGYSQMLGKSYAKGTELSGGQWQKIALARAYMRNPEVLILDEPTAAIDAKAEAEIFNKLKDLGAGKTLILISHRFSTVRQVDKIYVIADGGIREQGSHKELMQQKGEYSELYSLQARMYDDSVAV